MDKEQVILALAALAQATRMDVFRLLVKREPEGVAAGDVAATLSVPHNTLSSHLAVLERAGLISSQRHGRSIVYRADLAAFEKVALFLLKDCCGGQQEMCASLIESLKPCCAPKSKPAARKPALQRK